MGLQDRDGYRADKDRRDRESAARSGPVTVSLAMTPPSRSRPLRTSVPFRVTRLPFAWRKIGLLAIAVAAVGWASFSVERAVRQRAELAAAADQARQREKERLLSEQAAADEQKRQLAALAASQAEARATAAAARAELEAVARAKAADDARQAATWQQFYKPAPQCSTSWTVDCANAYIRAKRRFAQQASAAGS